MARLACTRAIRCARRRSDPEKARDLTRAPPLGRVRRHKRFFIRNLNLQKARNGQGDAEFQLGLASHAPKNGADFLHQFGHNDLLLVMGNDEAQVTHRGEELHPAGRNEVEKCAALAATRRCIMVWAKD